MEKRGLGDIVHEVIKKTMPKIAEKYKNCEGCKKRRRYLNNNVGAKFK